MKTSGYAVLLCLLATCVGCVSTPTGDRELSPAGEAILQTSARIAVRRWAYESPRTAERVRNFRAVVEGLGPLEQYTTVRALRVAADFELSKHELSELDRRDAKDLLDTFELVLRDQMRGDAIAPDAVVKVGDFLQMLVRELPAV